MEVTIMRSVEDVFKNFMGRRSGLIKALTEEKGKLFEMCDPEKDSLCLHGYPDGSWQLEKPVEDVPADIPEPFFGINHSRDDKDWRSYVAIHSDSWLLSLAFYFCASIGLGKSERARLFEMINELPTIREVVNEKPKVQSWNLKGKRSNSSEKKLPEQPNPEKMPEELKEKEEEDEGLIVCSACGEHDVSNGFWIRCDPCSTWFHGKCVKVTAAKAERIKQYECPYCRNSRRVRFRSS